MIFINNKNNNNRIPYFPFLKEFPQNSVMVDTPNLLILVGGFLVDFWIRSYMNVHEGKKESKLN